MISCDLELLTQWYYTAFLIWLPSLLWTKQTNLDSSLRWFSHGRFLVVMDAGHIWKNFKIAALLFSILRQQQQFVAATDSKMSDRSLWKHDNIYTVVVNSNIDAELDVSSEISTFSSSWCNGVSPHILPGSVLHITRVYKHSFYVLAPKQKQRFWLWGLSCGHSPELKAHWSKLIVHAVFSWLQSRM